ncbi:ABC transporter ATP-binding protein [bacterium]|nr:ABC transporter ATP-binding protein [bacterium]
MEENALVKVEGVSKKFCRKLKRSLWYGLKDLTGEIVCLRNSEPVLRPEEFWSLKDVSFAVKRGEMLGLIGQNGAGKSTLLKLLHGLINPDSGKITMRGRVQALIELGAGFSPILTGRENVYINASILGISKKQIDQTLPHIIEFAGIEDFMDTPVQNYSSGMKARLGFSVITQLDPDVLLIDEVLAVGDTAFQEKCMRRMDVLRKSNKAIIFVTHSLYQVEALCDKALWLEKGRIVQYGEASDIVRDYLDNQERRAMSESQAEGVTYEGRITTATRAYFTAMDSEKNTVDSAKHGNDSLFPKQGKSPSPDPHNTSDLLEIIKVELVDAEENVCSEFPFLSDITVRIYYYAKRRIDRPLFNLRFLNKDRSIFEASMLIDGYGPDWVEGQGMVECEIPKLPLTPKVYNILLFVRSSEGIADLTTMRTVANFRITDEHIEQVPLLGPMAVNHLRQGSPVYIPRTWRFYNGECPKPIKTIEVGYES